MECRDISYITGGIVGFPILAIYCLLQGRLDALLLVGLFALVWYLRVKWLLKIADHHWRRFHG